MLLNIISAVAQLLMFCMLVMDTYLICYNLEYKNANKIKYTLIIKYILEMVAFIYMLHKEYMRIHYLIENPFKWLFYGCTIFIMIVSIMLYHDIYDWRKNQLSVDTIKEGIDDMPFGICFYDNLGRPVLMNHKMNDIGKKLTGAQIGSGCDLWETIQDRGKYTSDNEAIVIIPDNLVYLFTRTVYDDIVEIIANDITESYRLTQILEQKNEQLLEHTHRLREYSNNIEILIRDREILESKIRIHSDMGRLLLMAKHSIMGLDNTKFRKETIEEWKDNIKLTQNKKNNDEYDSFKNIKSVAATIGLEIVYTGIYPTGNGKASELLLHAIHECVTNTVSHANGNRVNVKFEYINNHIVMECTNNGIQPKENIVEGGGLTSLRNKVESYGGIMEVISIPQFILRITVKE